MPGGDAHHATTREPDSFSAPEGVEHVLALTILHHPDLSRVGERAILGGDGSARLSRLVPTFGPLSGEGAPLNVSHLSRRPIFIESTGAGLRLMMDAGIVRASADGVVCGDEHPLPAAAVARGVVLELSGRVALLLHHVSAKRVSISGDFGLAGVSDALHFVRERIARVAQLGVTVLVRGESGTGKELVAQAVHGLSDRRDRPFVSVNIAAVPVATAAAALFGHTRGAFTGALSASRGYFGSADGGTLFLDEIGDTPAEVQPAMLRALETGEVQPLGEESTRRVDVRVIAATDADLERAVAAGQLRQALLQRLESYVIDVPPLCDRPDDVGVLLVHFLGCELAELGNEKRLATPDDDERPWLPCWLVAMAARARWPGNVRQLRNVARQLAIDFGHLTEIPRTPAVTSLFDTEPAPLPEAPPRPRRRPEDISEDELIAALRDHGWQPANTAVTLGISRTSLYALMKKSSRIRKAADLSAAEITGALSSHDGDTARAANALSVSQQGLKRQMHDLGIR